MLAAQWRRKALDEPATPAEAKAIEAKLDRAGRLERKRAKRLSKEIGAVPVLPGGGGGDEEPAGEDTQPA